MGLIGHCMSGQERTGSSNRPWLIERPAPSAVLSVEVLSIPIALPWITQHATAV